MEKNKSYIAVDIGKHGAIAIITENSEITVIKMPLIKTELDYHQLSQIINGAVTYSGKTHVVFEKLGVIFGSSKQTAFSMGEQSGAVEMSCICQGVPYTKVRAVDWQKQMFQGIDQITKPSKTGTKQVRDTKAMALIAAFRLFPNLKLTFGDKATKPHDGLIDAVLLAEYARRMNF